MKAVVFLSLFLLPVWVFGQGGDPSKWDHQHVTLNLAESVVSFNIFTEEHNISPQAEKTYLWFKAGKIMSTKGGFDGNLLDGVYTEFYPSKQLMEKGAYKMGLRDGEWTFWFPDGTIKAIHSYKNGVLHGPYKTFHESGLPVLVANYQKGQLHGEVISYEGKKVLNHTQYKHGEEHIPGEGWRNLKEKLTPKKKLKPQTPPNPDDPPADSKSKKSRKKKSEQKSAESTTPN